MEAAEEIVVESPLVKDEQRVEFVCMDCGGIATLVIRPPEKLTKKEREEVDDYFLGKQRGLYFEWVGAIGEHFGNAKPDQHLWLKQEMLLPLLESEYEQFAETMSNLRTVYLQGSSKEALHIRQQVAALVSVRDKGIVNRHIMYLYMQDVKNFAASEGVALRMPEDFRNWDE